MSAELFGLAAVKRAVRVSSLDFNVRYIKLVSFSDMILVGTGNDFNCYNSLEVQGVLAGFAKVGNCNIRVSYNVLIKRGNFKSLCVCLINVFCESVSTVGVGYFDGNTVKAYVGSNVYL